MTDASAPRIHLGPVEDPHVADGIRRAGGVLVPLADAEGVVWVHGPETFPSSLPDSVRWAQLPFAGIEPWFDAFNIL